MATPIEQSKLPIKTHYGFTQIQVLCGSEHFDIALSMVMDEICLAVGMNHAGVYSAQVVHQSIRNVLTYLDQNEN